MGKMLLCRDLGFDCDGIIHAKTENEIFRIASEHAAEIHEVEELTSTMISKIKSAIREEGYIPLPSWNQSL